MTKLIPPGTKTPYGVVSMIGNLQGERYYWMIDKFKSVSMIPTDVVENFENIKERKE